MDKFELWREVRVGWPSQEGLGGVYSVALESTWAACEGEGRFPNSEIAGQVEEEKSHW